MLDLGVKRWPINSIRIGPLYVELVELELYVELELELESELELVGEGMCMGEADASALARASEEIENKEGLLGPLCSAVEEIENEKGSLGLTTVCPAMEEELSSQDGRKTRRLT